MKIYQAVQKLLVGANIQTHTKTDRQTGDLISLLSCLESRLKNDRRKKPLNKSLNLSIWRIKFQNVRKIWNTNYKRIIKSME
jgi:hypothetical protein